MYTFTVPLSLKSCISGFFFNLWIQNENKRSYEVTKSYLIFQKADGFVDESFTDGSPSFCTIIIPTTNVIINL